MHRDKHAHYICLCMRKILSNQQIRDADMATMAREPIDSIDLMERAASACTAWIEEHYDSSRPILIMAGVGNNGGDALAIARMLIERNYAVRSYVVRYSENFSKDMQINLDRLRDAGHEVCYILEESQFPEIPPDALIVDGLFGSGLRRKADGLAALCIAQINASIAQVISIDLPSGLFADVHTGKNAKVITASHTLAFQVPKLAFLIAENEEFVGRWHVLDIGLDAGFIAHAPCNLYFIESIEDHVQMLARKRFAHKGQFGHGMLIAGSEGKIGAALLAANAALRSGIGKLTTFVPACGINIMQCALPEAMCIKDELETYIGNLPDLKGFDVIACGPGLGTAKKTKRMLKNLLTAAKSPLVLDADALNLLAEGSDLWPYLPENSILTPHVGEFDRLFGPSKNSFDRLHLLQEKAAQFRVIIVLKGANTAIALPNGEIYFNSTGSPGMATAGSGDVLTGVILSMLGQIDNPKAAAICGVYFHGLAGELAAEQNGMHGMVATDIIQNLGKAIAAELN